MPSIGSTLKEARTKKAVTLDDVHSKIKIHPRVLQLLEEEKFDKLPSPVFVKSFLRSYAEFLEVSGDDLVGLYEKDKVREPDQVLFIRSAEERDRSTRLKPVNLTASIAIGAGILVFTLLVLPPATKWVGGHFVKARENMAAFYKNSAKKKKESAEAKKKEGEPAAVKEAPKVETRDLSWLHSAELGNFPAIPKKEQLELEIRAVDTVWLKILTDGKTAFQGLVKKGEKATATANEKIEISTGNPDNMFWNLNGHSIGSPGKGIARKMMVTREGIRNLQMPRAE